MLTTCSPFLALLHKWGRMPLPAAACSAFAPAGSADAPPCWAAAKGQPDGAHSPWQAEIATLSALRHSSRGYAAAGRLTQSSARSRGNRRALRAAQRVDR